MPGGKQDGLGNLDAAPGTHDGLNKSHEAAGTWPQQEIGFRGLVEGRGLGRRKGTQLLFTSFPRLTIQPEYHESNGHGKKFPNINSAQPHQRVN